MHLITSARPHMNSTLHCWWIAVGRGLFEHNVHGLDLTAESGAHSTRDMGFKAEKPCLKFPWGGPDQSTRPNILLGRLQRTDLSSKWRRLRLQRSVVNYGVSGCGSRAMYTAAHPAKCILDRSFVEASRPLHAQTRDAFSGIYRLLGSDLWTWRLGLTKRDEAIYELTYNPILHVLNSAHYERGLVTRASQGPRISDPRRTQINSRRSRSRNQMPARQWKTHHPSAVSSRPAG